MSSMSEALSGFEKNGEKKQARHSDFIGTLLQKTTKIQREMRGRRYKEVQAVLQEAVDSLKVFQTEEWPRELKMPSTPEWMQEKPSFNDDNDAKVEGTEEDEEQREDLTVSTEGETVPSEAELSVTVSTDGDSPLLDEDPLARHVMPDAVTKILEAYIMVLTHPYKTNRACDATLDCVTLLISERYVSGRAGIRTNEDGQPSIGEDGEPLPAPPSLLKRLIDATTGCADINVEGIQIGVVKSVTAIMTSPKCGIHEASMLKAIRATFHVYLVTKSSNCKTISKASLLEMIRSVFSFMEAYDVMVRGNSKNDADSFVLNTFASQYHTDAYLLFRALCKLSAKPLPGEDGSKQSTSMMTSIMGSSYVDPMSLQSKILSLQLLLALLDNAGEAFCTSEKFIYAVQNYLCVSLLKNCTSTHTQVAYLSQKIFLILVCKFKLHLKTEIEVFMSNIFLRVLESPNSSFQQKALVLESLRTLCSDPVLLTQIFLNYDCDLDARNLYKEIVHNLTKLSGKSSIMNTASMAKKEAEQEFELSLAGSEVLVAILQAFLQALELPGGEDVNSEGSASARLREILELDVAHAPKSLEKRPEPRAKKVPDPDEASTTSSIDKTSDGGQASSSDMAGKIVGTFEKKQSTQQNFELGSVKFTLSLKSGIQYFVQNGFVELDARSVARFFLDNKDKLDKTQMGEGLGKEPDAKFIKEEGLDPEKGGPGFWVRVLHHYVDALDFTGIPFDDAIRLFLSGFRLPGEAQKIDRIMEKFAERFTRQNLDVFPSADTAFILAFSVIMLNTDLHNPSIKPEKRMTTESFIRNNRGISVDGTDLPEEFLTGIFKRIQAQPFSLKEDDDARERLTKDVIESSYLFEGGPFFGTSAEDRKKANFRKEREEMMMATEHLFKKRPGMTKAEKESKAAAVQMTDSIAPADVVKPMFDVTWGPLIGTLSQVLECSTDERSIAVCLNGFAYAIRIAANSHMSLARDTFINSLAKFTYLGSIKEMKHKNIESIKTLMSIAIFDGEHLCESWGPVLQCISQLSRLRLVASSLDTDESFITEKEKVQSQLEDELVYGAGFFRQPTKAEINKETEESNGKAILDAVSEVLIDRVFLSTVKLSAMGIAHFIEQLIAVSASEITGQSKRGITGVGTSSSKRLSEVASTSQKKGSTKKEDDESPRIFSLQRLVEVADYNMDVRPRLIWAQMWELMAAHFAKIGCHENAFVSTFSIDSLRQLSFKFLEKPELSEFNFQRIFLRPFLEIMSNKGTREDIRELILRCLDNMVRSMSHNLRSGWKVIFSVLAISADDPSERINTLGLAILQRLLDEHLHQLCRLTDGDDEAIAGEENEPKEDMSALERRNRNANVEDFVGLCRASLAFVQTNESLTPIPIGLSMRALCHTACYADLLADHRVLPPVSGAQSTDPHAPGYTYDGLSESEALEMALWRPLLDGLAEGVRSSLPSHAGGMGCLVQRGSVLALRAILLRHGHSFSTSQWGVIMKETLLPCIQDAAESDSTPVIHITSESPSVSSLEFVAESQPLPPSQDDKGLQKFAKLACDEESAPQRPLGKAELLVEASFADMRHRGDGNLSQAYKLVQKNVKAGVSEQPFPDSWIATTSGIALGMITDIVTEILLERGEESRDIIWPLLSQQLQLWIIGHSAHKSGNERPSGTIANGDAVPSMAVANGDSPALASSWQPCEALIRIACRELYRFPQRLVDAMSVLGEGEVGAWATLFVKDMASTLSNVVVIETGITEELLRLKLEAFGISENEEEESVDPAEEAESHIDTVVETPFGEGRIIEQRTDTFSDGGGGSIIVKTDVVQLESGATLYRPSSPGSMEFEDAPAAENGEASNSDRLLNRETLWEHFIPALKVQCVAAYCLQHSLSGHLDWLVPLLDLGILSPLLDSLDQSRSMSSKASQDQDLSLAFQEAMFSEWGDGVEEVEETLQVMGRSSNQSGSATFFLTQDAGATNNSIHILSLLYRSTGEGSLEREAFAEPLLLERTMHVLNRFVESETREGHVIDPNIWRNASKSGEKIALYCTSFAFVVVNILNVMLSMTQEQFTRHKQQFYPALCLLVRVQSDEIRLLVSQVLQEKIAPLFDVTITAEA